MIYVKTLTEKNKLYFLDIELGQLLNSNGDSDTKRLRDKLKASEKEVEKLKKVLAKVVENPSPPKGITSF